ncbi:hypothetical protein FH972_026873 [Carpinus fangiana]|uniref:Uncharacterized protein n=1 Tax=Carpinus fangiana TaxID=176857 RepID=A0A5N6L7S5_9ROSI|nr:hypothetical protein FH972_026873 [Carpinus fangiana]
MSEYGDDGYGSDDDWAYLEVEDYYDDIDDLIEHACPSPPYIFDSNVPGDYDPFDYFGADLEYLSDCYFDSTGRNSLGSKRKRAASTKIASSKKKRRHNPTVHEPVIWRSQLPPEMDTISKDWSQSAPFALLKDWHKLFHNAKPIAISSPIDIDHDQPATEGFDLNSLQSVAALLGGESLEDLKVALVAKGLDPEALQVVLSDLMSGQEPDFAEDDEEEDNEDDEGVGSDEHEQNDVPDMQQRHDQKLDKPQGAHPIAETRTKVPTQPPAARQKPAASQGSKRKLDAPPDEEVRGAKRKNTRGEIDHGVAEANAVASRRKLRSRK